MQRRLVVAAGDDGLPAFSAHANDDRDYNENDVVIFDGVILNSGESYLQSSSVFLCPVDGIYMFSINLITRLGQDMLCRIKRNNYTRASVTARGETESTGSNFLVMECLEGDKVWVEATANGNRMDGGNARHSIFSPGLWQLKPLIGR